MRRRQACRSLLDDVDRPVFRQRPVLGEFVLGEFGGDRASFDQLHHQEEPVAVMTEVVHRHDVRIAQSRGGSRLAVESLGRPGRIFGRQQQLDRDRTSQLFIGAAEDLSHPAPPQRGTQPVSIRNQHPDTRTHPQSQPTCPARR
jgi:hypothetical protein